VIRLEVTIRSQAGWRNSSSSGIRMIQRVLDVCG
jgi:hypothetical protein